MIKIFTILFATMLGLLFSHRSLAQIVSENSFLRGQCIEVGIDNTGAFGTDVDAPAGYHPRGGAGFENFLGFVADPAMDGWTVGSPSYIGDYFLPGGVPHEGWSIWIDGVWNRAWRSAPTATGDFTAAAGSPLTLTGTNISHTAFGSKIETYWQGSMGDLLITQKTTLDTSHLFFVVEVTLKNSGITDLPNMYVERTMDPENEAEVPGGSTTQTRVVQYQPDGVPGGDNKCLVSATGTAFPAMSYMGLGTVDCRAKAFILPSGQYSPGNYQLDDLYNEDVPATVEYDEDAPTTVNSGMGIVWEIGMLPAGDSTVFSFAYILHEDHLDSAFSLLNASWEIEGGNFTNGDTLEICRGKELEVNITGGGAYVWGEWAMSTGGSLPAGRHHIIEVPNVPTTYTVIGTTTVCPENDTLVFTIIPVGDSIILNEEICFGEIYDFNGQPVYQEGTYTQVYSTVVDGCDSVIQLNLTVNGLPNVGVVATETILCEGEEALLYIQEPTPNAIYEWYRDGSQVPGASGPSYMAPSLQAEYRVYGETDRGCVDSSDRIPIQVVPAATANITDIDFGKLCIGDTIEIRAESESGYDYYWSPERIFRTVSGNRQSPVYGIVDKGVTTIILKAINTFGCIAFDSVTVVAIPCCEVMLPTVFSPNNDGLNDQFNILLHPTQKVVTFQVFNRYGNLVYDNNDQVQGWNGRMNNTGEALQHGVYYYRIIYTCTDGANYETKGDITLVR